MRNILDGREVADVAGCVVTGPPVNQKFWIAVQIPNAGFAKTDFAMTETQVLEFSVQGAFLFSGSTSSRRHPILFVVATPGIVADGLAVIADLSLVKAVFADVTGDPTRVTRDCAPATTACPSTRSASFPASTSTDTASPIITLPGSSVPLRIVGLRV